MLRLNPFEISTRSYPGSSARICFSYCLYFRMAYTFERSNVRRDISPCVFPFIVESISSSVK